jgi:glutaryl-CoA dehydrogenase
MAEKSKTTARFVWDDPLLLDEQLSEEERMVRDTAAQYCQEQAACRASRRPSATRRPIRRSSARWANSACSADDPGRVRRRRPQLRLLRPDRARGRARRLRLPLDDERAVLAGDGADLRLRHRGAAQKYLPKLATGEWIGCFGLTEPNHGSDPGSMETARRRCPAAIAHRLQDVDLQLARSPTSSSSGPRRRRRHHPRLHPREGHEGPLRAEDRRQVRPARLDHRRDRHGRGVRAGREPAARRQGLKGPFGCLNSRALRHRLGRARRRRGLLARARQYTLDRKQFGRPLAANQLIQKKLADMQTEITLGLQAACASAA